MKDTHVLTTLTLALLAAALTPASRADTLVYEAFNYGATNATLTGQNGGTGFNGAWGSPGSGVSNYNATGLTFSDLPVSGGRTQQASSATSSFGPARQLNVAAQTGTLYGSYLFRTTFDTATVNVGSLLLAGSATASDSQAKFGLANNAFNTNSASARIGNSEAVFSGTAPAVNTTYLYVFTLDGLGAASQTVTGWVLGAAQYDAIKAGGITTAELNANNTETGSVTLAGTQTFTGTEYLRLFTFTSTTFFVGMSFPTSLTTDYDELRLATALNDGISGIPEPGTYALALLGGAGLLGAVRRRSRWEGNAPAANNHAESR